MHLRNIYRLSSDEQIQSLYQSLPQVARDAITRRDQVAALRSGISIEEYLYLISNPLNE